MAFRASLDEYTCGGRRQRSTSNAKKVVGNKMSYTHTAAEDGYKEQDKWDVDIADGEAD